VTLPANSGFWATGRLAPFAGTRFNVQNVLVAPDTWVEAFADGMAVWSKPGSTFVRSIDDARGFLGLIAASHTLVTGRALDFTFTGWVEATKAAFDGTVVGFTVPRGHPLSELAVKENSPNSRAMKKAIEVATAVFHRGPWRLAVLDVHSARAAVGLSDDAFVSAYRAIEDLAWAFSPAAKKSWPGLHAHLGTNQQAFKRRLKSLQDARDAVVHGNENDPALVAARANASPIVALSRRVVREAFAAEPTLPTV
jgi:hypothetical protein